MSLEIQNTKLPKAPLQEVVLDIKWNLDYDTESNLSIDKGFESAVLKFSSLNNETFNEIENLKPEILPSIAFNYKPLFRFRNSKKLFPLYQIGPGIFSVNSDNENYTWSDFLKLTLNGIQNLKKAYPKDLIIKNIELRYIDSIQVNTLGDTDKFTFLEKHLNVKAENYSFTDGKLEGINFIKKFRINDKTFLIIDIATGQDIHTMQEGIYWHTIVKCNESLKWDEFENWLSEAHELASSTFKKMINSELYEYFSRT